MAVHYGNTRGGLITDGLVLYYDTANTLSYPGSGTTLFDLSTSGLNATGSTPISGGFLSDTQPYTTATTSILNDDTHTICMWIQINDVNGSWSKIFGYEPAGTDRSPGIWRYPSQRYLHWRYDPGNSGADFSSNAIGGTGIEFSPGVWYYVAVTKNNSLATSYVNGKALGVQEVSFPKTSGTSTVRLYPAYNQGTSRMQVVQIYNRPLSSSEMSSNFRYFIDRYSWL